MKIFNLSLDSKLLSPNKLIRFAETRGCTANILKEYLISNLLEDDNVLGEVCEKFEKIGDSLKQIALEDIKELWGKLSDNMFDDYIPSAKKKMLFYEYQASMESIVNSSTAEEMLEYLILHYSKFGAGKNAKYTAFRWQDGMIGIEQPDDITLDQLFCLERQKKILTENTELFLMGLPANNALLYGTSGSGKSAIVKAILNKYYSAGLRLIEIHKESLNELPRLINFVKNKRLKYIIFMDDLSFEADDADYKNLKVLLDGRIEKQPTNILLYATSNRFHIINETWRDRQGDDIHLRDTINERLSLSQRFGIRINFITSKIGDEYFEIIESILSNENIDFTDEIKNEAFLWERLYNGRSGRTASQFAKMIIASKKNKQTKIKEMIL